MKIDYDRVILKKNLHGGGAASVVGGRRRRLGHWRRGPGTCSKEPHGSGLVPKQRNQLGGSHLGGTGRLRWGAYAGVTAGGRRQRRAETAPIWAS
jgi:hypothetical protein